jgi:hypothetical protein
MDENMAEQAAHEPSDEERLMQERGFLDVVSWQKADPTVDITNFCPFRQQFMSNLLTAYRQAKTIHRLT